MERGSELLQSSIIIAHPARRDLPFGIAPKPGGSGYSFLRKKEERMSVSRKDTGTFRRTSTIHVVDVADSGSTPPQPRTPGRSAGHRRFTSSMWLPRGCAHLYCTERSTVHVSRIAVRRCLSQESGRAGQVCGGRLTRGQNNEEQPPPIRKPAEPGRSDAGPLQVKICRYPIIKLHY